MIPMFFGAVYTGDRLKAWTAMIFPAFMALYVFAVFGRYLFYETGILLLYVVIIYLAWGLACVFTPGFVWERYVKLSEKIGGKLLFRVIAAITAVTFAAVAFAVVFTIAANANKSESDYIPPFITTTDNDG